MERIQSHALLVDQLVKAAIAEEWQKVDEELAPQLKEVNGNQTAPELLNHIDDPNPNVRDVVATSLAALDISDRVVLKMCVDLMKKMAIEDEEKFPAGRAAAALIRWQEDEEFSERIRNALNTFYTRVKTKRWKKELIENIPQLATFLTGVYLQNRSNSFYQKLLMIESSRLRQGFGRASRQ